MDFNWHTDTDITDENNIWEDDIEGALPPIHPDLDTADEVTASQSNVGLSKQNLLLLTLMIMLAGAIFMVTRWGDNQIDEREALLARDIRGSYQLLYRAIQTKDTTHLQGILNRQEHQWISTQLQMINAGTFLDRPIFDLYPVTEIRPDADVEIGADQQSAFVRWVQPYQTIDGEAIQLIQTHYFVYLDDVWQLTPVPDSVAGEYMRETNDDGVEVNFREIERPYAMAMLETLAKENICNRTYTASWCHESDMSDFPRIRFTRKSDESLFLSSYSQARKSDETLILPSPILSGLPADDKAKRYMDERYIQEYFIAATTTPLGASDTQFATAVLKRYMANLSLRDWPYMPQDYTRFFLQPAYYVDIPDLNGFDYEFFGYRRDEQDAEWHKDLFAEFWFQSQIKDGLRVAERSIATMSHVARAEKHIAWLQSLREKGEFEPNTSINTISQELELVCYKETLEELNNPSFLKMTITSDFSSNIEPKISPLPDHARAITWVDEDTYVLSQDDPQRLTVYKNEIPQSSTTIRIDQDNGFIGFYREPIISPTGRFIVAHAYSYLGRSHSYHQIDRKACMEQNDGDCKATELQGRPFWNVNDTYVLLLADNDPNLSYGISSSRPSGMPLQLTTADGGSLLKIENARAPFWLDEMTFGFLQTDENNYPLAVVTGTIDTKGEPVLTTWLTWEEITKQLSDFLDPSTLISVESIVPLANYSNGSMLMFALEASNSVIEEWMQSIRISTIVQPYNMTEGRWQKQVELPSIGYQYQVSPNGRWVFVSGGSNGENFIVDLQEMEIIQEGFWSPSWAGWQSDNILLRSYPYYLVYSYPELGDVIGEPFILPPEVNFCFVSR